MIQNRPSLPQREAQASTENENSKPYCSVNFPFQKPEIGPPAGQDRFRSDSYHGKIFLSLEVKTALHVSTGVVVPGGDVGLRVSLVKTMASNRQGTPLIPGSSLKGAVRSVYEAITLSCVCKTKVRELQECKLDTRRNRVNVCVACRVFGAMNWQGLVRITDAICDHQANLGFMPSLYPPRSRQVTGRKFYYHSRSVALADQSRGIAVQWVPEGKRFSTCLTFSNLTLAELGVLLIVFGQHPNPNHKLTLKVGGGKPIGMGTVVTTIEKIEYLKNLKDRYCSYTKPGMIVLEDNSLSDFMVNAIWQAYTQRLVQEDILRQMAEILKYPTDREAPSGMY